jgi:hypothetical protein
MRQSTVEQSTVVYRGTFAQMLPWLPIPGNKGFATLSKGLSKYGLSPANLEIEAPSNRLNDFVLSMSLLSDRLKLKLSWGWFEFLIGGLYEEDEPSLIEIAGVLFATLAEIDSETKQSIGKYQSYSHLKLGPSEAEEVLRENLVGLGSSELVPDAFAYQLKWTDLKEGESARIVVARSLRLDDGLFVDLSVEYVAPSEPAQMVDRMNQDYGRALGLLGLQVS